MIRKILSGVLVSILLLSLLPTFAADSTKADEKAYEEALAALQGLEIITDVSMFGYHSDMVVTKGEFTAIVVEKLMKLNINDQEPQRVFTDVSTEHPYADAIFCAYRLGLISGNPDQSFGADLPITAQEAITILIHALGYKEMAQSSGGYPTGYLAQANTLRLLSRVSIEPFVNRDVVYLLYNALEVDLVKFAGIRGEDAIYSIEPGCNILTEYMDLDVVQGVVTRNANTSLTNPIYNLAVDEIYIDNASFRVGTTNADALLGYRIKAYYKVEEATDDRILVYAFPYKNDAFTLNAKYIQGYQDFIITYLEDEYDTKERELELSNKTDFILNGKAWSTASGSGTLLQYGELTAVDHDRDGIYDVVLISSYENYIVSSVSFHDSIIYSKIADSEQNRKLDLSNVKSENLKIYDAAGQMITLEALKENDILSVKKSLDGLLVEIWVSNETLTGTITEISSDGDVEIDYILRTIAPAFRSQFTDWAAGWIGTFYLDKFGAVTGVADEQDGNLKYGYLVRVVQERGLDGKIKVKMYSKDGEMLILSAADKLTIDENSGQSDTALLKQFTATDGGGTYTKMQVVKYRTSGGNILREIQTMAPETKKTVPNNVSWRSDTRSFGSAVLTSADTAWFVVPTVSSGNLSELNNAPETAFSNAVNLSNNEKYSGVYAYEVDDGGVASVIVRETAYADQYPAGGLPGDGPAVASAYVMVDKITSTLNQEGEEVPKLYVMEGGVSVSYPAKNENVIKKYQYQTENGTYVYRSSAEDDTILQIDTTSTPVYLQQGDIIQYRLNGHGEIVGTKVIWDISRETSGLEKTVVTGDASAPYHGRTEYPYKHLMRSGEERGYVYGTVVTQKDGFIGVLARGINDAEDAFSPYYYNVKGSSITIYDSAKKEIRKGSLGDITDEKIAGTGSKVFIHNRWYSSSEVFILK